MFGGRWWPMSYALQGWLRDGCSGSRWSRVDFEMATSCAAGLSGLQSILSIGTNTVGPISFIVFSRAVQTRRCLTNSQSWYFRGCGLGVRRVKRQECLRSSCHSLGSMARGLTREGGGFLQNAKRGRKSRQVTCPVELSSQYSQVHFRNRLMDNDNSWEA